MSHDIINCPGCDVEWDGAPDACHRAHILFCPLHGAAGTMLEALREAVDFLEPTLGRVNSTPMRKAYEMARDAIAKAEGIANHV